METDLTLTYSVGYRLNRLDEPIFMAVSKPLLTESDIHHRLESCVPVRHVQGKINERPTPHHRKNASLPKNV